MSRSRNGFVESALRGVEEKRLRKGDDVQVDKFKKNVARYLREGQIENQMA